MSVPSGGRKADKGAHCRRLQCARIEHHLYLLHSQAGSQDSCLHTQTLSDSAHGKQCHHKQTSSSLSTQESKLVGTEFLLGSSQQLPELKHSTLRTGRCGHGQVLVVLLCMSDILFHIQGCDPEPQLHSEGSQDFLACRGS